MSDLSDNTADCLPLERLEELPEPERTTYAVRQVVLLRKLLGRELMRRGKRDEVYKKVEMDHAVSANVESDGKGNYLATLAR